MRVFLAPLRASFKILATISMSLLFRNLRDELDFASSLLCIKNPDELFSEVICYVERKLIKDLLYNACNEMF